MLECDDLQNEPCLMGRIQSYKVSVEQFETFYSEHFVKQVKTMKLKINIIRQITKKMNEMRDHVIYKAPPVVEQIVARNEVVSETDQLQGMAAILLN